ncbi:unnamed protein product [Heligmosomoides polygyrus]|uniref:Secreted protein n=1 Tax=Heligmosomoides polygyrus TaxID=6339 RepID=A0A183FDQ7_HELPZ|nr:unnamed protein product [Heligmosomoides polygyrus]
MYQLLNVLAFIAASIAAQEKCDVYSLVEENNFVFARNHESAYTRWQQHGKKAAAVCCSTRLPPEPVEKWRYQFTCDNGKWQPEMKCGTKV